MRTTLTQQQTNLLYADWKEVSWLFEVDVGNTGSVDYYWSTKAKTYGGQSYTFKILDFSPLQLFAGYPELGILPESRTTIQLSFKDNIVDAYYASDFEGASVTIKLIVKAALGITEQAGDVIEFDSDTITTDLPGEEETEIMSWCFKVASSTATYQKMTWECVDWFSEYLEGDYPNTSYLSDLFPADIMKNDTYCVPLVFGTAYFPLRWVYKTDTDYYILGEQSDYKDTVIDTEEGTLRAATVAEGALFWDTGQDFTDYVGAAGSWKPYALIVTDSGGKVAWGYIGEEGTGETLGAEKVTNGDMELDSNWADAGTPTTNERSDAQAHGGTYSRHVVVDEIWSGCQQELSLTEGELYKISFWYYLVSGGVYAHLGTGEIACDLGRYTTTGAWTQVEVYKTLRPGSTSHLRFSDNVTASEFYIDDVAVKEVTALPADQGIKIYSTKDGSTQSWASVESGFNPNQNSSYEVRQSGPTYTIDRCRAPVESGSTTEYPAATYTFTQSDIAGSDGNNYRAVKAIIHDSDNDGTNDANGFWGGMGKDILDVPFKFYRSDLSSTTNPANIIEYILEDMGVPSGKIDADAQTAAAAIFTSRGITLNIPLWYRMPRKKLLCKILAMCGMVLIIRDKIYMKVLTSESQLTIEKDLVLKGTFRCSRSYTEKRKDSGYVVWQKASEPIGQGKENKSLIAAKSATDNPSDTTVECEWISDDDGVKQQKAGKLALQRNILRDKQVYYSAKGKILILEPADMITINPADYGAESSSYDVLIDKMVIHKGLRVDLECTRFSDDLDDWDDLSASSITVSTATTTSAYRPIMQGGRDNLASAGERPNDITQSVYIASNGILATNEDPATNGGFKATNTELTCYNTSGDIRFQAIYSGANQGDVIIGNYSGNSGVMWDQSAAAMEVRGSFKTTSAGVKRTEISASDGEMHFYGDRGDTTIEELATIGINTVGSDQVIGQFGTSNSTRLAIYAISDTGTGVYGKSDSSYGIYAYSNTGIAAVGYSTDNFGVYGFSLNSTGVKGVSSSGYAIHGDGGSNVGGYFEGGSGPICLKPSSSADAPTGSAEKGTLWVTSAGVLYINTDGSTTWAKVGAQ